MYITAFSHKVQSNWLIFIERQIENNGAPTIHQFSIDVLETRMPLLILYHGLGNSDYHEIDKLAFDLANSIVPNQPSPETSIAQFWD